MDFYIRQLSNRRWFAFTPDRMIAMKADQLGTIFHMAEMQYGKKLKWHEMQFLPERPAEGSYYTMDLNVDLSGEMTLPGIF